MLFRTVNDRIIKIFNKRLVVLFSVLSFCLFLLIVRLFYLQIISYEKYKMLSDNNRIRIVRVFASRGMIMDRKRGCFCKKRPKL